MRKLVIGMLAGLSAVVAQATQATIDGLKYELNEEILTAKIIGRESVPKHLEVDRVTYEGVTYAVTGIAWDVFNGCSELVTVAMPSAIDIGCRAFAQCPSLKCVSFESTGVVDLDVCS